MSASAFTLEIDGVSKEFGPRRKRFTAVQPIDLHVDGASRLGVIGESGSGKSTIARMIVGLEQPTTGEIRFNGRPVRDWLSRRQSRLEFRRSVQYVAQDTSSSFDPRRTMYDAVATPLRFLCGVTDKETVRQRLHDVAIELSLDPAMYDRYPSQLSGGQRQRFSIARSLVVEPRLLICDEVVSALDVSVQGRVLNLLKRSVARHEMGLIFVAHGLPAVAFISDELIVMRHGAVVERGAVDRILAGAAHPYTAELLAAYSEPGADAPLVPEVTR